MAELASVLGVCIATVWNWVKKGLPVIDKSIRPWLIDGEEAKFYFEKRIKASKSKMLSHQFHCFKCRRFVTVVADSIMVKFDQYINQNDNYVTVKISGNCSECGHKTNRYSTNKRMNDLLKYYGKADVQIESK